ncbi:MAG: response regulator transcription factor [Flavobacteriaceae bacterium]|nr:response regulator transcription factor [Flavobacteriaceae bacterium]
MENWETISLTISLLLLVISMGLSSFFSEKETTTITTLLCMILVGVTTFMESLSQQKHSIPPTYKIVQIGTSIALTICVILVYFFEKMAFVQYVVVGFLVISVITSMLITRQTKPVKQYKHLEKSNRVFAFTFLTLVPIYLAFHYAFEEAYQQFQMGFLLYFAFIALAIRKIFDDLHRLSLVNNTLKPIEQHFKNYGLTKREQEIAILLFEGLTYQSIADQLFISLPTIKTHASNIYKKCKVKSRNELTKILAS